MAYKLEDHWLEIDRSVAWPNQTINNSDINIRIKAHIQKYMESHQDIETAEFSDVIQFEPPTRIDIYA